MFISNFFFLVKFLKTCPRNASFLEHSFCKTYGVVLILFLERILLKFLIQFTSLQMTDWKSDNKQAHISEAGA